MNLDLIINLGWQVLEAVAIIIGGATILFRGFLSLAELTKTDRDNIFISKVLNFLSRVSLNVNEIKKVFPIKKK